MFGNNTNTAKPSVLKERSNTVSYNMKTTY